MEAAWRVLRAHIKATALKVETVAIVRYDWF